MSEVISQCSILLHLMDICFLTCICLWQISQIQTFLFKVVGPGLVSTSPAFVSNSASHAAGPHGRCCFYISEILQYQRRSDQNVDFIDVNIFFNKNYISELYTKQHIIVGVCDKTPHAHDVVHKMGRLTAKIQRKTHMFYSRIL